MKIHDTVFFRGVEYYIQGFTPIGFPECVIISESKYDFNVYLTIPFDSLDKKKP